ncbi:ABC transporter ATP-binding protein [Mesorhizobium sp. BAC0120]|uniref:ABC transporter ATP-binding protein n=1 Tax=Mesorhizobium sp. BAC0120 TaxID=3090670 RepID=UPI00298C9FBB|nr:ABC transporter ATP-binding protein [Mesorhizobium sp. BAC0120]MDW6021629.1 ABC transporter ATP-binding protein [Mesorhizobium sp. BAC0120]
MTDAPVQLSIDSVVKKFGALTALKDISLDVSKGEFVALLGPSGCGKTTLLKIIAGLVKADSGTLTLEGQRIDDVPTYKRDIGIVFQSYALFPHMSVEANIRFGLEMRRVPEKEARERVAEALAMVKLEGFARRMPQELSGGQQQRVAIARALVIRPRLLLLDEPLSNLDAVLRKSVRVELRELHENVGLTTVMVTHDQEEAMSMADRVTVMANGEILQHDTPTIIYERPATDFVAGFVGNPPAVLVDLAQDGGGGWLVCGQPYGPETALGRRLHGLPGRELRLGLRPERLAFVSGEASADFIGHITSCEYIGGSWLAHVDIGGARLTVPSASQPPAHGTTVYMTIADGELLAYDRVSGQRVAAS